MTKTIFLTAALSFLAAISAFSQTDFQWKKDLDLPFIDQNGHALTGTEVIHIVNHKGKMFAGNSYWNETTAPRRGQIWTKNTASANWQRDFQMPQKHSRVPSLYSFSFKNDKNGQAIAPDTLLFAGATFDYANASGPAVVFTRNDADGTWATHDFLETDHPFGYTQVRSMGFHHDKITGADLVFAGANPAPTGAFAGRYNPSATGKIEWDAVPEFTPAGYQRIMGFANCNDTFYMATQREIYRREDGAAPKWVQVLNLATPAIIQNYGANLDTYWLNDEDIRGFRSIKNPSGGGEVLMFGALNHIFRVEPKSGYQLVAEQDIEAVLETATGHDFHYLQAQIIKDFAVPNTSDTVQLIGFEAFYDTAYLAQNPQPNLRGFNQEGWYFERKQTGTTVQYALKEIRDFAVSPADSLARVRTFEVSPFASDSGKVIYSGGFAPWFIGGVTNTAWIYKGIFQQKPTSGNTVFKDINYKTGSPQNELNLDIHVPNAGGAAKKPVIIYVHGGAWRTGDKANTANKDEFFTNLGYVFISINYRLSPDPIALDDPDRLKFPVHPEDVAAAIAWVFNNISGYGGDTSRVSLLGHSSGAHLVSLVSTDENYLENEGIELQKIKCTCSLDAGGNDIPYYLNKYESPGTTQWNTYENAFGSDQAVWENASPITHVLASKGIPNFMLVFQGTPQRIDLSNHFGNVLLANGVPTTLVNAAPLDHEGINQILGSTLPQAKTYNDTVANFFSNCLKITVSTTVRPSFLENRVKISPNPTASDLVIDLAEEMDVSKTSFNLFSMDGKWLENIRPTGFRTVIDLGKYPQGGYFLEVLTSDGRAVFKLMKGG